jgi:hypothetical protein
MMMAVTPLVIVSASSTTRTEDKATETTTTTGDKSHHKQGGGFVNPWPSFKVSRRLRGFDRESSQGERKVYALIDYVMTLFRASTWVRVQTSDTPVS